MRSNIARTCVSGSRPDAEELTGLVLALERGDVLDQLVELLRAVLLELPVGRHRRGRVDQRARDRVGPEPVADLGQVRAERVPILADLVAGEAAGGRRSLLPLPGLLRRGQVDGGGRPG